MSLPLELQQAIEALMPPSSSLKNAREELTTRYRVGARSFMTEEAHRLSYLATRMPATFAALTSALRALRNHPVSLHSLLDLGAGPGTALWSAKELFPQITTFTLVEQDPHLIQLGKQLSSLGTWICANLEYPLDLPPHDLVILSYVLSELKPSAAERLLKSAWEKAQFLLIVEPGTPQRFSSLKQWRALLLAEGAHLLAPCPHSGTCPNDWCHFSARLPRTSLHRRLKTSTLNYEDEKFSYLLFSKEPYPLPANRILRHPFKGKGHIQFSLCTPEGLTTKTLTRKDPHYKDAKKLTWGSTLCSS